MRERTCLTCDQPLAGLSYRHRRHPDCSRHVTTETRTRSCAHCRQEFTYPLSQGADRRYCSDECRHQRARATAASGRDSLPRCSVDGCAKRVRSRGATWCGMHYHRMYRTGRLDVPRAARGECHHCGAKTPAKRIFCSNLCQARERSGVNLTGRTCVICDATIPNERDAKLLYCRPECKNAANRIRSYGITVPEWRELRSRSTGCGICGQEVALVIDHEHSSGLVRGLLCGPCNAGIGMLGDSPERLIAAADYLRSANTERDTPDGGT